jgi:hypothetical protein
MVRHAKQCVTLIDPICPNPWHLAPSSSLTRYQRPGRAALLLSQIGPSACFQKDVIGTGQLMDQLMVGSFELLSDERAESAQLISRKVIFHGLQT